MTFCAHLRPLVEHLRAHGLSVTPCDSPYGDTTHAWWSVPCVFSDVPGLRKRLGLDAALTYEENFMFAAGADAMWTCAEHRQVLIGPNPKVVDANVPRVT